MSGFFHMDHMFHMSHVLLSLISLTSPTYILRIKKFQESILLISLDNVFKEIEQNRVQDSLDRCWFNLLNGRQESWRKETLPHLAAEGDALSSLASMEKCADRGDREWKHNRGGAEIKSGEEKRWFQSRQEDGSWRRRLDDGEDERLGWETRGFITGFLFCIWTNLT